MLSKINLEFLAGTNISAATDYMYNLHIESGAEIETVFNGIRISFIDNKLHKILTTGKPNDQQ